MAVAAVGLKEAKRGFGSATVPVTSMKRRSTRTMNAKSAPASPTRIHVFFQLISIPTTHPHQQPEQQDRAGQPEEQQPLVRAKLGMRHCQFVSMNRPRM